jgi:hypothetical protein
MTTKTAEAQAPERPVFERIPVDPFVACDGHASQAIQALVTMLTPSGAIVYLCGHHARKSGFEHTADAPVDNRQQGSDH